LPARVDLCAGAVERIEETATSRILFTRRHVFKLRRPLRWPPYLDYSTPLRRWQAANREHERSRRFAPELYQAVVWLRPAGEERADAAVCMARLPPGYDTLLRHLRRDDGVAPRDGRLLEALLDLFERLHAVTRVVDLGVTEHVDVASRFSIVCAESRGLGVGWGSALRRLARCFPTAYNGWADARSASGLVRELHGDLHTDNVLTDGRRYLPFDSSDFEERFVVGDVALDLGFLLADLFALGRLRAGDPHLDEVVRRTATPLRLLLPMVVYGLLNRTNVLASRTETRELGTVYLRSAEQLAADWLQRYGPGAA